jgi:very-short-patch-repair endonuclease
VILRDIRRAVNIAAGFRAFPSVRTATTEVQRLVDRAGVVARREHPELQTAIAWLKRRGELTAVLPGVYTHPSLAATPEIRIRAVGWWDRDAVLTGAAAARISFWPNVSVPLVTCAVRSRRPPQPGYAFERRSVPPWLVVEQGRLRLTRAELTALDLCVETDGGSIDEVLRTRAATLGQLHEAMALTRNRLSNPQRRQLLLESRAAPWSVAERKLHRLLRSAGIIGWTANPEMVIEGQEVHPDVLFDAERLVIEVDGRRFHSDRDVFESDRRRQNLFVVHGWCVLRFTVRMIEDEPDTVIATVRAALAMLASPRPPRR